MHKSARVIRFEVAHVHIRKVFRREPHERPHLIRRVDNNRPFGCVEQLHRPFVLVPGSHLVFPFVWTRQLARYARTRRGPRFVLLGVMHKRLVCERA